MFWYEVGGLIYLQKKGFISQSTPLRGPLAIQVNEASKLVKRHKQRCATSREGARTPHGSALPPVISGQGCSPSARPGGASPPRRPITATPPLRPVLDRKAGTEAAHLRLQHGGRVLQGRAPRHHVQSRVQKQKAHSRAEHWGFPRAPQAQDKAPRQKGSKTANRAARNKRKQPAFVNKCDTTALAAAVV